MIFGVTTVTFHQNEEACDLWPVTDLIGTVQTAAYRRNFSTAWAMRTTICNHACMIYWSVTDRVCVLHTGDAVASYSCRTMWFWCIGGLRNKDQRDTAHGTHNVAQWSSWPSGYEHDFASEASSESFNSLNYYPRCSAQHLTSPKACLSSTTNLFLIRCDVNVWPGPSLGKRLGPSGKLKVYLNLLNVYLTHLLPVK